MFIGQATVKHRQLFRRKADLPSGTPGVLRADRLFPAQK
jgi:hypothetical protein